MSENRTTSGVDLLLAVRRRPGLSLRTQLQQGIREAVREGLLPQDAPMPSSRVLARDLGVSRGVVVEAYDQLIAEGYLVSRRGSGTRVATAAAEVASDPLCSPVPPRARFDFRPGVPDLDAFPRSGWLAAMRGALDEAPASALGYGDPQGALVLRQELAGYLGRVRGVVADPTRVVVCSGLTQGLALLMRVLRQRGILEVAVEDPGWPRGREFLGRWGFTAVPVAIDRDGLRVDQLATSGVSVVMVTPAHQFPTGVVLSPSRRAALLQWARRHDGIVIEDDYDAEFRYDREPIGALQGLAPDHVVYGGSMSKILAPALRLAWLVVPPALRSDVLDAKYADDRGSPALDQLTLARFISSGALDRHCRRCRLHYRTTRDLLVQALHHVPDVRVEGIAAGLHLLAWLAPGCDEASVIAAGAQRSVGLYGLGDCTSNRRGLSPALVVGYGGIPRYDRRAALEALTAVLGAK